MIKFFRLSFLPSLLLFCGLLNAQKKTVSGFYITLQGDTVKGTFAAYNQWSRNPSEVQFISNTSKTISLSAQNSRKFVIEGYDEYLSYTGKRLLNPIEDQEVIKDKAYSSFDDQQAELTTFLRLVTRTTGAELYVFNDSKRLNFFYRLPNQPITELNYKKYYDQDRINEVGEYKQQLNNLFSAAIKREKLTAVLESLPYNEEALEAFFEKLHPTQQAKPRQYNPAAGWLIEGGMSLNSVKVTGDKSYQPVNQTYNTSFSPIISIGYYLPLYRNFGKYFFYPQVKLFRYKSIGEQNDGVFINRTTYQTDLVTTGEVTGGINVYNTGNIRFYLAGGIGFTWQLNGKELHQMYAASTRALFSSAQAKLSPIGYTVNATAGVMVNNKIRISATYLIPSLISNNPFYSIKLNGVQLRAGYKL